MADSPAQPTEPQKPKRAKKGTADREDASTALDTVPDELVENDKAAVLRQNGKAIKALTAFGGSKLMNRLFLDGDPGVARALIDALGGVSGMVEALTIESMEDAFRQSVLLSFESSVTVYEGEVTDMRVVRDDGGEVREIHLTLMAAKGTKTVKLGRQFRKIIRGINIGDIVYIEPTSGLLKRIGRSESRCDEYDLEGDKYVQLNRGAVNSRRKRVTKVSLYDFDFSLSRHSSSISVFTRTSVDSIVRQYIGAGVVSFVPSSLVINSAHMLSMQAFSVLRRCSDACPWVKVLLVGRLERAALPLDGFLVVRMHSESLLDILRSRHANFDTFSDALAPYLDRVPLEKLEDAIAASEGAPDFVRLMGLEN